MFDDEFNFIISDDELEKLDGYTENDIEEIIDTALSAVIAEDDNIHIATSKHGEEALCGTTGESALYIGVVFDLAHPDFCDECVVWKLMES